jgi:HPt (histidine-containing phosphotransfer) domain-containing protein
MPVSETSPLYSSLTDADMAELVQDFVTSLQERAVSLRSAAQAENLAEITRLSHQLKGASGGYGFDCIGVAAGQLEAVSKAAQSVEQIRNEIESLVGLCLRARPASSPA